GKSRIRWVRSGCSTWYISATDYRRRILFVPIACDSARGRRDVHFFPTRRSSDLGAGRDIGPDYAVRRSGTGRDEIGAAMEEFDLLYGAVAVGNRCRQYDIRRRRETRAACGVRDTDTWWHIRCVHPDVD